MEHKDKKTDQQHSGTGDNVAKNKNVYNVYNINYNIYLMILCFAVVVIVVMYQIRFPSNLPNVNKPNIDYYGRWDSSKIADIVLRQLSQTDTENKIRESCFKGKNNLRHFIVSFYDYDKSGDDDFSKIAIVYSRPENYDCHGCGVALSFIQFTKETDGWRLGEKYIAEICSGSYGEPPTTIKVLSIGYNILGIEIEGCFTNQGFTSCHKEIYANPGGEFKKVLEYSSYEDDSGWIKPGLDSCYTTLDIKKEGSWFYDLILTKKGVADGKKIDEKKVYKYDGIKYIEEDLLTE